MPLAADTTVTEPTKFDAAMVARADKLYASPRAAAQRARFRDLLAPRSGETGVDIGCDLGHLACEQIRRADASDEKALAGVRRSAILALAVPAMSIEQAEKWATRAAPDRIAGAIRDHDVWIAAEGAAIGWVEVHRDRVAALYVLPSHCRREVGSLLLAFAECCILGSGYVTARLESSRNALDFYLRRGYLQCGLPDPDGAFPLSKNLDAIEPGGGSLISSGVISC